MDGVTGVKKGEEEEEVGATTTEVESRHGLGQGSAA
jgi:hypothetical protein